LESAAGNLFAFELVEGGFDKDDFRIHLAGMSEAITAHFLGIIESRIRFFDEALPRSSVAWRGGNPNAHRDLQTVASLLYFKGFLTDALKEHLSKIQGLPSFSVGQENHELVAGITDGEAVLPRYFPE
jgi:hypothetical protein